MIVKGISPQGGDGKVVPGGERVGDAHTATWRRMCLARGEGDFLQILWDAASNGFDDLTSFSILSLSTDKSPRVPYPPLFDSPSL